MRVDIGDDYYLCSDRYQYWIEKESVSEKGKAYSSRCTGYFCGFDSLITDFAKRQIRSCDVNTIKQLKEAQTIIEDTLMKFSKNIVKEIERKGGEL